VLGLACLSHDVGVALAENLCEGVRTLLSPVVSLIVIDAAALRLTMREHVTLFDGSPPGPVVVAWRPRRRWRAASRWSWPGFRVLTNPVAIEELLEKALPWPPRPGTREPLRCSPAG